MYDVDALVLALLLLHVASAPVQARNWMCNNHQGNGVKQTIVIDRDESGKVMDGPGGIISNSWCEFIVSAPQQGNQRVKLTFNMMQMLSGDDFVWVYDRAISLKVPVERITGTYTPPPRVSASALGFIIEFRSSQFGVGHVVAEEKGFDIDFQGVFVQGKCNGMNNPCSSVAKCLEDERGAVMCTPCPIGFVGDSSRRDGCVPVQPCPGPRVRKEFRQLSPRERQIFMDSLQGLRALGYYDQIMWVHADKGNFNFAHLTDGFLPWHREYLIMMEDALRSVSPASNCITIPFWDWTLDAADPLSSIMFTDSNFGGTGVDRGDGKKCVASGPFKEWTLLGNDCLQRDLNGAGFIATREEVLNVISSNDRHRDFSRAIELFHDTVHRWIGGTMVLDNSADEPLFIVHHSFIDMLWSVWQDCHNYDLVNPAAVQAGGNVFTGGYETGSLGVPVSTALTRVMPFRLYEKDPNVAARDLLDNGRFGISYANLAFLQDPTTAAWFDARRSTCTVENLNAFTGRMVPMGIRGSGFQVLQYGGPRHPSHLLYQDKPMSRQKWHDEVVLVGVGGRGEQAVASDSICHRSHLNMTQHCNCFGRWRRDELRRVSRTFPVCQRNDLLACANGHY